jgi:hypothetical protein
MKPYFRRLIPWAIITLVVHIVVQEFILPEEWSFLWAYPAHALLWILSWAEELVVLRLKRTQPDQLGMAYMAGGVAKFFIGLIYLLPFILYSSPQTRPVALWFFMPYFSTLIFQARETIVLIQSPSEQGS